MPIIVISPSKAKAGKVCRYIMQDGKTRNDLKFGYGCIPDKFDKDFELMNMFYMKANDTDRRTYYHIKLSWAREDQVTPEDAKEMAIKFCEQTNLKGCQYAGSIHTDTGTIHAHIVVNNARFEDSEYGKAGHSYQATRKSRAEMMQVANDLARKYGYLQSAISENQRAKEKHTREEIELVRKGKMPWKDTVRNAVDESKVQTNDINHWKELLKKKYGINVKENRKGNYVYILSKNQKDEIECSGYKLGTDYEKKSIVNYFSQKTDYPS